MSISHPLTDSNVLESLTVVALFVTDKKFRKMGGLDGLEMAHRKDARGGDLRVCHVTPEMLFGANNNDNDRRMEDAATFVVTNNGTSDTNCPIKASTDTDVAENGRCMDVNSLYRLTTNLLAGCKLLDTPDRTRHSTVTVLIVQKMTDFFKDALIDARQSARLEAWLDSVHGVSYDQVHFRVIDPLERTRLLSDRMETGKFVRRLCDDAKFSAQGLQWPAFTHFASEPPLALPVIIKPIKTDVGTESHAMLLVKQPCQLETLFDGTLDSSHLIQQFHPHDQLLYKVYVIGDTMEIVPRPSVSLDDGPEDIFRFNTHTFKTANADMCESTRRAALARIEPFRALILSFVMTLALRLQLTWFGVDVIIPEQLGDGDEHIKVAVIDINYLPGYDGVDNLSAKLLKAMLDSK